MKYARYLVFAFAAFIALAARASVDEAMRDILKTYDFDPATMSFDEQAARAPTLSKLGSRFEKSHKVYRDALRVLLAQGGAGEMLYCDGGMLLLQNATSVADKGLGLQFIQKCSLAEIQQTPYFHAMHSQALAGVDTIELQYKMLTKPKYQVFIPMHALTLAQDYAFAYPLLVQDEAKYTKRLVEKLETERDPTALNTLLLALWHTSRLNQ